MLGQPDLELEAAVTLINKATGSSADRDGDGVLHIDCIQTIARHFCTIHLNGKHRQSAELFSSHIRSARNGIQYLFNLLAHG